MFKGINWIAVAIAVALLEVVGYVWYGLLFVKPWTDAMVAFGHTPGAANVAVMQSLGVVNSLIVVLGLAWLTRRLGAASLGASVGVALAAWFFFDFTTQTLEHLFMEMPAVFVAINMGYQFIAYALAGAVLGLVKTRPARLSTAG